jgi:hypothetical protein
MLTDEPRDRRYRGKLLPKDKAILTAKNKYLNTDDASNSEKPE